MATKPIVLLVEENRMTQETMKRDLEALGLDVLPVFTTEEAWNVLENGTRPDMLLLDFILPGRTGPDLGIRVHEDPRFYYLPIIPFIAPIDEEKNSIQTMATKFGSSHDVHAKPIHSDISKNGHGNVYKTPECLILSIVPALERHNIKIPKTLLEAYIKMINEMLE